MRKAHVVNAVPAQVHGRHLFAANQPLTQGDTNHAATPPKNRAAVMGSVKASLDDFERGLRNELAVGDAFIFNVTDTSNYDQWRDYLTYEEMRRVFLRVMTERGRK